MTREDIEKKVTDILVEKLGVGPEDVKSEANFREDLGGDSLDLVVVVMKVEHEFRISVTDEEADQVNTVADIIGLVEKYQK
jgi:acyl carrier protein